MTKPAIYCFINAQRGPDDFTAVALAEDGVLLASHISSSVAWAICDMGASDTVTPIGHSKHRVYGEHYPDGYRVVWVDDPMKHPGVLAATPPQDAA